MPSSTSRDERRKAFLLLGRTLGEADVSISSGEVSQIEMAVKKVSKAFDLYWSRCQEDIGEAGPSATPSAEARRVILRTLTTLLLAMDQALSEGDLKMVKAALDQAKEAVEVTASLDEAPRNSGIRQRFPGRLAK
jgi:hypothetical protein